MTANKRRVRHICPDCGRARLLKPADAARTKRCQRCHCQKIAPLGFQATAAKKGRDFAIRAAARKRKRQPSTLEEKVEAALTQIPGIDWEREFAVERAGHNPYYVDFAIHTSQHFIALEVNGSYAHRRDEDKNSLRRDTLFLFFDDVIVLTESEVKQITPLHDYIRSLIF